MALIGRSSIVCSGVALGSQDASTKPKLRLAEQPRRLAYNRSSTPAEGRPLTACNAIHCAEQRLCRWLAQAYDQTGLRESTSLRNFSTALSPSARTSINKFYSALEGDGVIVRRGILSRPDQPGHSIRSPGPCCRCREEVQLRRRCLVSGAGTWTAGPTRRPTRGRSSALGRTAAHKHCIS